MADFIYRFLHWTDVSKLNPKQFKLVRDYAQLHHPGLLRQLDSPVSADKGRTAMSHIAKWALGDHAGEYFRIVPRDILGIVLGYLQDITIRNNTLLARFCGLMHSPGDRPAYISGIQCIAGQYYLSINSWVAWMYLDQGHRDSGPAEIRFDRYGIHEFEYLRHDREIEPKYYVTPDNSKYTCSCCHESIDNNKTQVHIDRNATDPLSLELLAYLTASFDYPEIGITVNARPE